MVEKPKRDLKMKFAFKKGSLSNILKFCSIAMSIVLFFFSVWVFVYDLYPELKSGYFNIATFFAGTTSAAGCAISALVAKSLLKIKVLKETYFFIVFVFSSSALSFIVADFAFGIDVQPSLLVGFWIILGTILSYVISGNTPRELIRNIWRLVLRNGVSILTILLLASLPIIEILPSFQTFSLSCSGTIEYQNIGFENSKGITHESGDGKTVFIKEIPLSFDRIFIDSQIVDIKNPSISDLV